MAVRLEPWSESALALLRRIYTPEMRRHVGGPEAADELLARHRRYLAMPEAGLGRMFAVLLGDEMVGSIAYHQRDWQGEAIYEAGWNVLPPYQGRGIAAAAGTALIDVVREAAREPGASALCTPSPRSTTPRRMPCAAASASSSSASATSSTRGAAARCCAAMTGVTNSATPGARDAEAMSRALG
ncbi:GNAT family N-acetyltransferase [Streptomyces coryli]|uniref:GNAT family N-acetyltransferase n=1 Tax=Streptomyces coryli TaxID=1128680 RepID=UPI0030B88955